MINSEGQEGLEGKVKNSGLLGSIGFKCLEDRKRCSVVSCIRVYTSGFQERCLVSFTYIHIYIELRALEIDDLIRKVHGE